MKTAEEKFNEFMEDAENFNWYQSRPKHIQELAKQFPFDTYIIKNGAPYALSCPGQKVHFYCYTENIFTGKACIKVIVKADEKLPAVLKHETDLYTVHNIRMKGVTLEQIHAKNIIVEVDPVWLEPVED